MGWVVVICECCDEGKFSCPKCGFQWRPDRPPKHTGHLPAIGWEMRVIEAAETGGEEAVATEFEKIRQEYGG